MYHVPSFHFFMAVDPIPESTIKKMQAATLKKIKKWMNFQDASPLWPSTTRMWSTSPPYQISELKQN